jgi:hypothetical protein
MGVGTGASLMTDTIYSMSTMPRRHLGKVVLESLVRHMLPMPQLHPDGGIAPAKSLKLCLHPRRSSHHLCRLIFARRKDARMSRPTLLSSVVPLRVLAAGLFPLTLLTFPDALPSAAPRRRRDSRVQAVHPSPSRQPSTWISSCWMRMAEGSAKRGEFPRRTYK